MKKIAELFVIGIAASTLSFGAAIICGSQNFDNGGGVAPGSSATLFCPTLDAGVGNHIASITLTRSGDAQLVIGGAPTVTIFWDVPTGVAGFGDQTFTLTPLGGIGSGFNVNPVSPISVTINGNFGQTVTLSNAVTSTLAGTVGNPSGTLLNSGAVLQIDYTTAPDTPAVPEPSSMALMGAALVSVGLWTRGRRS